jgi:hypothetical protein
MTRKFRNIKGYGQLGSLGKSWLCFANSVSLQLSHESSMIYSSHYIARIRKYFQICYN